MNNQNTMEKTIYSALYDVFASAWQTVEAEAQARQATAGANDDTPVELPKAA